MAVLTDGKHKITVSFETEEEAIKNQVAQHPVQRGQPIVDHTQRESKSWQMSGKLYGKNLHEVDTQYKQLLDWQYNGTLLTIKSAIRDSNTIIESLNKNYDDGGFTNAVRITIGFTKVAIVTSSFTKAKHTGNKTPTKPKVTGTWVTVKAGNTYWGWMMKYGTSISQLRKWNKWPDRRIPIGARARVK